MLIDKVIRDAEFIYEIVMSVYNRVQYLKQLGYIDDIPMSEYRDSYGTVIKNRNVGYYPSFEIMHGTQTPAMSIFMSPVHGYSSFVGQPEDEIFWYKGNSFNDYHDGFEDIELPDLSEYTEEKVFQDSLIYNERTLYFMIMYSYFRTLDCPHFKMDMGRLLELSRVTKQWLG